MAKLAVYVEAPREQSPLVGKCSDMAKACRALHEVLALIRIHFYLLWKLDELLVLSPKLSEPGLTPAVDISVLGNSETEERSTRYVVDWFSIE